MKIYHTETQADYDALMVELEEQGCRWLAGHKMTKASNYWIDDRDKTCVRIINKKATRERIGYFKEHFSNVPITKYKAKADEKMKFTKENVLNITDKWIESKIISFQDLQNEIKELDDTPEKVVVPKLVAEWIEQKKEKETELQTMIKYYRYFYDNVNSYSGEVYFKKAVQWYMDNPYKFIQAYEDGYTIEPEQLYYIPLPHLETSDGIQQVLSKRKNHARYFACCPSKKLKQRYTKEELEQVPEVYKPFAKPIEEEEE